MTARPTIHFDLRGRRALVTGAASGIGRAAATRLAQAGAVVALNDVRADALAEAARELTDTGLAVHAVPGDLGSAAGAREVAHSSLARLGGLDYLVNNAGAPFTAAPIPAAELGRLDEAFWRRILDVNLLAAFWLTQSLAGELARTHGAIVNTVSIAARRGGGSSIAYVAAKAGLEALTRELARGLAPAVRVNGIAPGLVDSPWECSFGDLEAEAKRAVALQRVGTPADYAELIVYLCAGAAYVTGEVIAITGGLAL